MIGTHTAHVFTNRQAPTGTPLDMSCLVDEIAINHGRGDTTGQPEPSSATLDFTVGPGAPLPAGVDIGAWLVVETHLGASSSTRFVGRITDMAMGWDDAGEATPDSGVGQLVAVSVLADYARRLVGDEPFPQELDGARVARIMALAGLVLDPAYSDPGTVDVIPRDVDARGALELAQDVALSGGGLVWQTRAGLIRYADSEHRRNQVVAMELNACDILVTPQWSRSLSGLVNEVSVGYGVAPEGGGEAPRYRATNADSAARYGRYEYTVTTELAELVDASAWASLLLTQNGSPVWMLNNLPIDVGSLSTAATQTLLGLELHALLRITGLPATGPSPTSLAAFVEGWTERLSWGIHELELFVSGYCRTAPPPRWDDTDPAITWDAHPGTWDDLICTGMPLPDLGRWDDVSASTRWDQVSPDTAWDETAGGIPA